MSCAAIALSPPGAASSGRNVCSPPASTGRPRYFRYRSLTTTACTVSCPASEAPTVTVRALSGLNVGGADTEIVGATFWIATGSDPVVVLDPGEPEVNAAVATTERVNELLSGAAIVRPES